MEQIILHVSSDSSARVVQAVEDLLYSLLICQTNGLYFKS